MFCIPQSVWIAKVLEEPEEVQQNEGARVTILRMKLGYYVTKVAKSSKIKMPILGTMHKCEIQGSKKGGSKRYLEGEMLELDSRSVLRAFEPNTYLVRGATNGTSSRLLQEHVKEAMEFAVTKERYITWLGEEE